MKNKTTAAILALFLGGLGIHKFYLGKSIGILYILFCWTLIPSIIAFIECIMLFMMSDAEFNAKYNNGQQPNAYGYPGLMSNQSQADELEKLYALKEKGVITQEEFEYKKRKML